MARWHIGKDNWFLVIPAAILGLVALWTVHSMYRAGDIRRSIQVVTDYAPDGRQSFGEWLAVREGALTCEAELVSRFYGTLDVTCTPAGTARPYSWRVHVGQLAFAPVDDATRALMRTYAPDIFDADSGEGSG